VDFSTEVRTDTLRPQGPTSAFLRQPPKFEFVSNAQNGLLYGLTTGRLFCVAVPDLLTSFWHFVCSAEHPWKQDFD